MKTPFQVTIYWIVSNSLSWWAFGWKGMIVSNLVWLFGLGVITFIRNNF